MVRTNQLANPAVIDRHHPALAAAALAYRKAFGKTPVFLRSGGSIPVVSTFQRVLSIPTVLMGFALPDDHIHAPNEKFHVPNFYKGIETCIWFVWLVSRQAKGRTPVPAFKRGEPIEAS
jgi:acetylornithine deacetylase/succinyl-diaminopimelate desuccinylase-like protein